MHLYFKVISSPDLKAQVSFSDRLLTVAVVRLSVLVSYYKQQGRIQGFQNRRGGCPSAIELFLGSSDCFDTLSHTSYLSKVENKVHIYM